MNNKKKTVFTPNATSKLIVDQAANVIKKKSDILDLGCGDGCVAASFARNNHKGQYYGFDINNNWIKRINSVFLKDENFTFKYIDIFLLIKNLNLT